MRGIGCKTDDLVRRVVLVCVAIAAAAGSFWIGREASLSAEIAGPVVSGLLHNIYLAHDFRDEERTYDILSGSVAGDLLTETYLETRRGLGTFVRADAPVEATKQEMLRKAARRYAQEIQALDVSREEAISMLKEVIENVGSAS